MLKQMREMSEAVAHPVSPDWNPVTFKLTEETADGPPAAGFSLTLTRQTETRHARDGASSERFATTCSPCRPTTACAASGDWSCRRGSSHKEPRASSAAWEAAWGWLRQPARASTARRILRVWPILGRSSRAITSFKSPRTGPPASSAPRRAQRRAGKQNTEVDRLSQDTAGTTRVRVRCSWPADLEKEQLVLLRAFRFRYRKLDPGLEWFMTDTSSSRWQRRRSNQANWMNQSPVYPAIRSVLCGPSTLLVEVIQRKAPFFWTFARVNPEEYRRSPGTTTGRCGRTLLTEDLREVKPPQRDYRNRASSRWEPGTFGYGPR